jgi:LacI family transcriptional regulator
MKDGGAARPAPSSKGRRKSASDGLALPARGPARAARPTIFDVAQAAGVSYATVSRVANGQRHVHPETRAHVQAAMDKLGYVVHRPAQSLASGQTRTIGLLAIEVGSSFFISVIGGVDEQVTAFDYDFMLCTTHDRRGKETEYVARLSHGMVDGLLVILPRGLTDYLEQLRTEHFPFVIIDYDAEAPGCNLVNTTNRAGGREAIDHLVRLGHRRIGFITGTRGVGSAEQRLRGYRDALAGAGVGLAPELVVEGDFHEPGGYTAAGKLLDLDDPPTAIFASSDTAAMGVYRAARDRSIRIPHDLSVIGFDDIPEASSISPALTTVRQPLRQMGKAAVRMLMGLLREPDRPPATMVLSTELLVRDSTAKPRRR